MQRQTDAFKSLTLYFRNGCSLLLKLLEPLLSSERFAEINEHVQKYSWHRWNTFSTEESNSKLDNLKPFLLQVQGLSDEQAGPLQ